ncbi:MAG: cytochrome c3 family protein, partial [Candidatus Acidiferrum sp.]
MASRYFLAAPLPLSLAALVFVYIARAETPPARHLNPAAWGSDHVGKPVPEYVTGDECLFCHRSDIGPAWTKNRHQRTIREAETDSAAFAALRADNDVKHLASAVTLFMGSNRETRFLKKAAAYGQLELLTAGWDARGPGHNGMLGGKDSPHWDKDTFGKNCAGCHTTGVDCKALTFAAIALDCYTCHGEVATEHSKNTELVHLAKKRADSAKVVTSICAQCHVRTGKSRSSGWPFPNNFVAGDNLFRDFQVDFSKAAIAGLNPIDHHVLDNVRDVVVLGKEEVTCVTCHDVHKQSSRKHRQVEENESCLTCHN